MACPCCKQCEGKADCYPPGLEGPHIGDLQFSLGNILGEAEGCEGYCIQYLFATFEAAVAYAATLPEACNGAYTIDEGASTCCDFQCFPTEADEPYCSDGFLGITCP